MDNIVFCFSGTGNCLKVAKTIVKELGNGEIVSMAKPEKYSLTKQYGTIGFIYPTYFMKMPKKTVEFISNLSVRNNKGAYYYVIATCGGYEGGAIYQMHELMQSKHTIKINYAKGLKMFANYVVMYDMNKKVDAITQKSNTKLASIISSIKNRENNKINTFSKIIGSLTKGLTKEMADMDRDYIVNDNCTSCGICKEVCPVKNIEIINNKPQFKHKCEQCMACIQFCPQKALNYKTVTQNRGRYTNPEIDYKQLSECHNQNEAGRQQTAGSKEFYLGKVF
jgi:ferredoxin/flavodoxin